VVFLVFVEVAGLRADVGYAGGGVDLNVSENCVDLTRSYRMSSENDWIL
jgi:hypothetical protein